ncbi:MFS transporter, CP family, cyanate transporter [Terribacillus halophilus]|uniref:MFS transporter, CP family, cyanate transporter n=1 Tax=Terribacillus halophilus TaxID=361279 RepID=A0A1G6QJA9_9BACI|nr:MFS transporter [Terribacillus halophilus]SDC92469.1 MFS transporter, CP family, cyanate transporter [Terribacillus halophilus]
MNRSNTNTHKRYYTLLLILAILFIAATLRSPLTSVGPLIPFFREELDVSNSMIGLVNTLPLLAFGVFSSLVPKISSKFGIELTLLAAMCMLTVGIFIRALAGLPLLLFGTLLLGMAIAFGNVLMPGLIKSSFPYQIGLMTGIYSVSMNIFGALASGISVPIASIPMLGWRNAMQIWSVLSLIAFIILLLRLPATRSSEKKVFVKVENKPSRGIFKSKIAWAVTLFMGLQSFIPYSLFTWLPDILMSKGFDESEAGWLIAIYQLGLIPTTFIAPIIAGRMQSQRLIGCIAGLLFFFGLVGVMFISSHLIIAPLILTGVGAGTAFSLAMMFFVLRTNSIAESSQLSSMAQSVGYLVAALGPLLLGTIAEKTNGWMVPLIILMIAALCIAFLGTIAGKDQKIAFDTKEVKSK